MAPSGNVKPVVTFSFHYATTQHLAMMGVLTSDSLAQTPRPLDHRSIPN